MSKLGFCLTTLIALAPSVPALACSPAEAQFIGQVTSVELTTTPAGPICTFKVGKFTFFNESQVCPLMDVEAIQASIPDADCSAKVGDDASGVLSIDENGNARL